jgi:hypothetical protein
MNLQEIEEQFKDLIKVAQRYSVLYQKEKENFPYRLNVIQELHDNENAHSRILMRLLQYTENGEYPWLRSFINRINDLCDGEADIQVTRPTIDTEYPTSDGRIDGVVIESGKYAIIIENKIWFAGDQYKQIDRYVKFVNTQRGVSIDKIYVIYLTLDGSKAVSDSSLSADTEKALGKRFMPMSFQHNILPWLEDDVLPNCKVKERCLETAIYQYIDYLKGRFGQLDYQGQAQKRLIKKLLGEMGIQENFTEIKKMFDNVRELERALESEVNKFGGQVAADLQKLTKEYFEKVDGFDCADNNKIEPNGGYYQIKNGQWQKISNLSPHFEWIPISYADLFESHNLYLVLHIEGGNNKINNCANILLKKANEKNIKYLVKYDQTKYFEKECSLGEKTFAGMTYDEKRDFLYNVYSSEEIQQIIKLMDETMAEYKE